MTNVTPQTGAPPVVHSIALPAGTQLQEFRVERVIGEGGFGIVYLADDTLLGRPVAIKEYMPTQLASRTERRTVQVRSEQHSPAFDAGRRSFINEARMLAQFKHRSLVEVFRYWEENGTAYMAMPFYDGPTLRNAIGARPEGIDQAWLERILLPIMDALEHMHRAKVYHRDIAPDNILLVAEDHPVLLDLGAARHIIGEATQAVTVMLKPGYAPIEQYSDDDASRQGPWTDIYALCAVVHFAVCRKSPIAAVGRIDRDPLQSLVDLAPSGFSADFLQAIDWGLAVRPEDRPRSIAVLRDAMGFAAPAEMETPRTGGGRVVGSATSTGRNPTIDPLEALAQVSRRSRPENSTTDGTVARSGGQSGANSASASRSPTPASASDLTTIPPTRPREAPATTSVSNRQVERVAKAGATAIPTAQKPRGRLVLMILAGLILAALLGWWVGRPSSSPTLPTLPTLPTPPAPPTLPTPQAPGADHPRVAAPTTSSTPSSGEPVPQDQTTGSNQTAPASAFPAGAASATPPSPPAPETPGAPSTAGAPTQPPREPTPAATTPQTLTPPPDVAQAVAPPAAPTVTPAAKPAPVTPAAPATPPGTVSFTVKPWGEVLINGTLRGATPPLRRLALPPGSYQIEIRNPAGPSLRQQITIRSGEGINLAHEF